MTGEATSAGPRQRCKRGACELGQGRVERPPPALRAATGAGGSLQGTERIRGGPGCSATEGGGTAARSAVRRYHRGKNGGTGAGCWPAGLLLGCGSFLEAWGGGEAAVSLFRCPGPGTGRAGRVWEARERLWGARPSPLHGAAL